MTSRRAAGIVALIALGVALGSLFRWWPPQPFETVLANRPECPHEWGAAYDSSQFEQPVALQFNTPGEVSIAGKYTNVPEYHDCQRLILHSNSAVGSAGARTYGALAAVFLSQAIIEGGASTVVQPDEISINLRTAPRTASRSSILADSIDKLTTLILDPTTAPTQVTATNPFGVPYAEVVSEGNYGILGIHVGFNCLYLKTHATPVPQFGALMVSFGQVEQPCDKPDLTAIIDMKPLKVEINSGGSGGTATAPADIPRVARWDWDSRRNIHVIGLPCRQYWCDVGPFPDFEGVPPRGHMGDGAPREKAIKGWYDEQLLADYAPGSGLSVSPVTGTIFPVAGIESRTALDYQTAASNVDIEKRYLDVAHVALSGKLDKYINRYGFQASDASGPWNGMARVALCYGESSACIPSSAGSAPPCKIFPQKPGIAPDAAVNSPWWARITFRGNESKYFCVAYRGHPSGFHIPGVARWRWRVDDETIWISCPQGCCEVDVDT